MRRLIAARQGGVAFIFALALPGVILATSAAIDYAGMQTQRSRMQSAADSGALAAVRELQLPGRTPEQARQLGETIAKSKLGLDSATVAASIVDPNRIRVHISGTSEGIVPRVLGQAQPEISVAATGVLSSAVRKTCVLTLDPSQSQALSMKSNAVMEGRDCLFQSNSVHSQSITSDSGITMSAQVLCSSGGFYGQGRLIGQRLTDCPPLADPLEARPAPAVSAICDRTNHRVELNNTAGSRHSLNPGVYCGGLFIGANSFVTLNPGIYVMKDGPLVIDSNADVVGRYTGFFLQGPSSILNFTSNAKVNLDAPNSGPMSGILMFEDRSAPPLREHRITSNFATNLTGTMYFPKGRLVVDASSEVAKASAYTVIIANQLLLTASPHLILNTNYNQTDVPVPQGIIGAGAVRLEN
ncbi:Putative Flp pilus-assembly TadG-like, N-terminal [Rhabdaerophilaceae bacterium]